ncbi:hypothetical protein BESB_083410 [Besnoitia besnoiti]|uniref:Uncharacterized protein n=1 Tax=Besnoitia besnoiti TaxID=94643 RepID=A0A2A9MCN4_BESBE|nr:hypothetical protein BESB_083410 [Besnoitia besnoiti]PFH33142.1 hypothetical protein BESB_083410 [Besnoitia besnoiti]
MNESSLPSPSLDSSTVEVDSAPTDSRENPSAPATQSCNLGDADCVAENTVDELEGDMSSANGVALQASWGEAPDGPPVARVQPADDFSSPDSSFLSSSHFSLSSSVAQQLDASVPNNASPAESQAAAQASPRVSASSPEIVENPNQPSPYPRSPTPVNTHSPPASPVCPSVAPDVSSSAAPSAGATPKAPEQFSFSSFGDVQQSSGEPLRSSVGSPPQGSLDPLASSVSSVGALFQPQAECARESGAEALRMSPAGSPAVDGAVPASAPMKAPVVCPEYFEIYTPVSFPSMVEDAENLLSQLPGSAAGSLRSSLVSSFSAAWGGSLLQSRRQTTSSGPALSLGGNRGSLSSLMAGRSSAFFPSLNTSNRQSLDSALSSGTDTSDTAAVFLSRLQSAGGDPTPGPSAAGLNESAQGSSAPLAFCRASGEMEKLVRACRQASFEGSLLQAPLAALKTADTKVTERLPRTVKTAHLASPVEGAKETVSEVFHHEERRHSRSLDQEAAEDAVGEGEFSHLLADAAAEMREGERRRERGEGNRGASPRARQEDDEHLQSFLHQVSSLLNRSEGALSRDTTEKQRGESTGRRRLSMPGFLGSQAPEHFSDSRNREASMPHLSRKEGDEEWRFSGLSALRESENAKPSPSRFDRGTGHHGAQRQSPEGSLAWHAGEAPDANDSHLSSHQVRKYLGTGMHAVEGSEAASGATRQESGEVLYPLVFEYERDLDSILEGLSGSQHVRLEDARRFPQSEETEAKRAASSCSSREVNAESLMPSKVAIFDSQRLTGRGVSPRIHEETRLVLGVQSLGDRYRQRGLRLAANFAAPEVSANAALKPVSELRRTPRNPELRAANVAQRPESRSPSRPAVTRCPVSHGRPSASLWSPGAPQPALAPTEGVTGPQGSPVCALPGPGGLVPSPSPSSLMPPSCLPPYDPTRGAPPQPVWSPPLAIYSSPPPLPGWVVAHPPPSPPPPCSPSSSASVNGESDEVRSPAAASPSSASSQGEMPVWGSCADQTGALFVSGEELSQLWKEARYSTALLDYVSAIFRRMTEFRSLLSTERSGTEPYRPAPPAPGAGGGAGENQKDAEELVGEREIADFWMAYASLQSDPYVHGVQPSASRGSANSSTVPPVELHLDAGRLARVVGGPSGLLDLVRFTRLVALMDGDIPHSLQSAAGLLRLRLIFLYFSDLPIASARLRTREQGPGGHILEPELADHRRVGAEKKSKLVEWREWNWQGFRHALLHTPAVTQGGVASCPSSLQAALTALGKSGRCVATFADFHALVARLIVRGTSRLFRINLFRMDNGAEGPQRVPRFPLESLPYPPAIIRRRIVCCTVPECPCQQGGACATAAAAEARAAGAQGPLGRQPRASASWIGQHDLEASPVDTDPNALRVQSLTLPGPSVPSVSPPALLPQASQAAVLPPLPAAPVASMQLALPSRVLPATLPLHAVQASPLPRPVLLQAASVLRPPPVVPPLGAPVILQGPKEMIPALLQRASFVSNVSVAPSLDGAAAPPLQHVYPPSGVVAAGPRREGPAGVLLHAQNFLVPAPLRLPAPSSCSASSALPASGPPLGAAFRGEETGAAVPFPSAPEENCSSVHVYSDEVSSLLLPFPEPLLGAGSPAEAGALRGGLAAANAGGPPGSAEAGRGETFGDRFGEPHMVGNHCGAAAHDRTLPESLGKHAEGSGQLHFFSPSLALSGQTLDSPKFSAAPALDRRALCAPQRVSAASAAAAEGSAPRGLEGLPPGARLVAEVCYEARHKQFFDSVHLVGSDLKSLPVLGVREFDEETGRLKPDAEHLEDRDGARGTAVRCPSTRKTLLDPGAQREDSISPRSAFLPPAAPSLPSSTALQPGGAERQLLKLAGSGAADESSLPGPVGGLVIAATPLAAPASSRLSGYVFPPRVPSLAQSLACEKEPRTLSPQLRRGAFAPADKPLLPRPLRSACPGSSTAALHTQSAASLSSLRDPRAAGSADARFSSTSNVPSASPETGEPAVLARPRLASPAAHSPLHVHRPSRPEKTVGDLRRLTPGERQPESPRATRREESKEQSVGRLGPAGTAIDMPHREAPAADKASAERRQFCSAPGAGGEGRREALEKTLRVHASSHGPSVSTTTKETAGTRREANGEGEGILAPAERDGLERGLRLAGFERYCILQRLRGAAPRAPQESASGSEDVRGLFLRYELGRTESDLAETLFAPFLYTFCFLLERQTSQQRTLASHGLPLSSQSPSQPQSPSLYALGVLRVLQDAYALLTQAATVHSPASSPPASLADSRACEVALEFASRVAQQLSPAPFRPGRLVAFLCCLHWLRERGRTAKSHLGAGARERDIEEEDRETGYSLLPYLPFSLGGVTPEAREVALVVGSSVRVVMRHLELLGFDFSSPALAGPSTGDKERSRETSGAHPICEEASDSEKEANVSCHETVPVKNFVKPSCIPTDDQFERRMATRTTAGDARGWSALSAATSHFGEPGRLNSRDESHLTRFFSTSRQGSRVSTEAAEDSNVRETLQGAAPALSSCLASAPAAASRPAAPASSFPPLPPVSSSFLRHALPKRGPSVGENERERSLGFASFASVESLQEPRPRSRGGEPTFTNATAQAALGAAERETCRRTRREAGRLEGDVEGEDAKTGEDIEGADEAGRHISASARREKTSFLPTLHPLLPELGLRAVAQGAGASSSRLSSRASRSGSAMDDGRLVSASFFAGCQENAGACASTESLQERSSRSASAATAGACESLPDIQPSDGLPRRRLTPNSPQEPAHIASVAFSSSQGRHVSQSTDRISGGFAARFEENPGLLAAPAPTREAGDIVALRSLSSVASANSSRLAGDLEAARAALPPSSERGAERERIGKRHDELRHHGAARTHSSQSLLSASVGSRVHDIPETPPLRDCGLTSRSGRLERGCPTLVELLNGAASAESLLSASRFSDCGRQGSFGSQERDARAGLGEEAAKPHSDTRAGNSKRAEEDLASSQPSEERASSAARDGKISLSEPHRSSLPLRRSPSVVVRTPPAAGLGERLEAGDRGQVGVRGGERGGAGSQRRRQGSGESDVDASFSGASPLEAILDAERELSLGVPLSLAYASAHSHTPRRDEDSRSRGPHVELRGQETGNGQVDSATPPYSPSALSGSLAEFFLGVRQSSSASLPCFDCAALPPQLYSPLSLNVSQETHAREEKHGEAASLPGQMLFHSIPERPPPHVEILAHDEESERRANSFEDTTAQEGREEATMPLSPVISAVSAEDSRAGTAAELCVSLPDVTPRAHPRTPSLAASVPSLSLSSASGTGAPARGAAEAHSVSPLEASLSSLVEIYSDRKTPHSELPTPMRQEEASAEAAKNEDNACHLVGICGEVAAPPSSLQRLVGSRNNLEAPRDGDIQGATAAIAHAAAAQAFKAALENETSRCLQAGRLAVAAAAAAAAAGMWDRQKREGGEERETEQSEEEEEDRERHQARSTAPSFWAKRSAAAAAQSEGDGAPEEVASTKRDRDEFVTPQASENCDIGSFSDGAPDALSEGTTVEAHAAPRSRQAAEDHENEREVSALTVLEASARAQGRPAEADALEEGGSGAGDSLGLSRLSQLTTTPKLETPSSDATGDVAQDGKAGKPDTTREVYRGGKLGEGAERGDIFGRHSWNLTVSTDDAHDGEETGRRERVKGPFSASLHTHEEVDNEDVSPSPDLLIAAEQN